MTENVVSTAKAETSPWGLPGGVSHEEFMRIFDPLPGVRDILRESPDVEEARRRLMAFCCEMESRVVSGSVAGDPMDRWLALEALRVFKNMLSPFAEKMAGFSTLECLWRGARGDEGALAKITRGFLEEFRHLFLAISGKAGYSTGWIGKLLEKEGIHLVDFSRIKGREAGIARSDYLDHVWEKVLGWLKRYPTGLDEHIVEKRKRNREVLLDFFGATDDDWNDYRWQFRNVLKGMKGVEVLRELRERTNFRISDEDLEVIEMAVKNGVPWGITPYYLHLFDFENPCGEDIQVRMQVIPPRWYVENMVKHRNERRYRFDFMGEHDTSPIDLVTRRYVTVAIVKPYDSCPQICVYCQRNWEVVEPFAHESFPGMKRIEEALEWFAEHESLIDVLITGGEPLALGNETIEKIMDRIAEMDHVIHVRWGTRIPVTVPMRITDSLAELLGSYIEPGRRNVCIVTHVESAYEVTPEMAEAVYKLRKQGIYVYNQLVMQRCVSRRFETCALRMALKRIGIDPYYTFNPKGKMEQKDYMLPIARIVQERKEEARLLPGVFRTDEPVFNVPRMGKNHLRAWQDREIVGVAPDGSRIYLMHPWEKGINPTKVYTYRDVPILAYLRYLESLGEDVSNYETIWYYY